MLSSRRWPLRVFGFMAIAIWAVLWPHNYGIHADTWYLRMGAAVLLTFRAAFIGLAVSLLILRPLMTIRMSDERPVPGVGDLWRMFVRVAKGGSLDDVR